MTPSTSETFDLLFLACVKLRLQDVFNTIRIWYGLSIFPRRGFHGHTAFPIPTSVPLPLSRSAQSRMAEITRKPFDVDLACDPYLSWREIPICRPSQETFRINSVFGFGGE